MTIELANSITLTPTTAAIAANRFVVMANAGAIAQVTTAGADPIGVAAEPSAANSTTPIAVVPMTVGTTYEVEAGAAIDISSAVVAVTTDSSGRVIASATGNSRLGFARQSAAAAGEIIEVIFAPATRQTT